MFDWLSSLFGGAASVANTTAQIKSNEKLAQEQRDWNEMMWNKQNEVNDANWLRETEYNSPVNQVNRLRDAGLNPLQVGLDGNGGAGMVNAAQPLGYERATVGPIDNPIITGLQAATMSAQLRSIEANIQKTKSETKAIDAKLPFEVDGLKAQVRNSSLDADAKEIINKYIDQQQQAELRMKNSTADEAEAAVQKLYAEIQKMDQEKQNLMIQYIETQEKILNLQKERELSDAKIRELDSLVRVNNATAAKIGLDVKNYDDIMVIGTSTQSIKIGPVTIAAGEPITLGVLKAIRANNENNHDNPPNKENGKDKSWNKVKEEYPE